MLLNIDLHNEETWRKALPTALELCRVFSAELHVGTIVPDLHHGVYRSYLPDETEKKLLEETRNLLEGFVSENIPNDIKVTPHVNFGNPNSTVLKVAYDTPASLIVLASPEPGTKDDMSGPDAGRIVCHAKVSVFVVRE